LPPFTDFAGGDRRHAENWQDEAAEQGFFSVKFLRTAWLARLAATTACA
jgi:hypothetical protein